MKYKERKSPENQQSQEAMKVANGHVPHAYLIAWRMILSNPSLMPLKPLLQQKGNTPSWIEALAIIFGVKHFHQYVYGRTFTIQSDHKPLQYIFDESKPIPSMTSARVQRWALTLGAYLYHICHKAGKDHGNADGLSRLPLLEAPVQLPQPAELINLMERLDSTPVSSQGIQTHTSRDPILAKVRDLVRQGCQVV